MIVNPEGTDHAYVVAPATAATLYDVDPATPGKHAAAVPVIAPTFGKAGTLSSVSPLQLSSIPLQISVAPGFIALSLSLQSPLQEV